MPQITKYFFAGILVLFFLSSCGREKEEAVTEIVKSDFFVETTNGKNFGGESVLSKTGQVRSSQDIDLSANASGRVGNISVTSGDNVSVGKLLAQLDDTFGSLSLNVQRSNNSIQRAKINYEAQKIGLEKQIFDSKINIQNLERSLSTLKRDSEQNIILGEDGVNNSQDLGNIEKLDIQQQKLKLQKEKLELQKGKFDIQNDKIDLQIENTVKNIEKSRFDYESRLKADEQTILNYTPTLKNQFDGLQFLLDDVIEFADTLLGVTQKNQRENDRYDQFLGANNTVQKGISKTQTQDLIGLRESALYTNAQNKLNTGNLTQQEITEVSNLMREIYDDARILLTSLEETVNNSIKSQGSLGDVEINTFRSNINGLQSQLQGNFSGFVSFISGIETFFTSFRDNQLSILKSIELQEESIDVLKKDKVSLVSDEISLEKDISGIEKDIENLENDRAILLRNIKSGELTAETNLTRTKIGIDDNIKSLETQLVSARNTLANAQKNLNVTLRSLQNGIDEARIGYSSSAKELEKLRVTSPINGTIQEVLVDAGQDVTIGTPLFKIVSDATPEVQVSFNGSEKDLISKGQKVIVEIDTKEIDGTISSISDVADDNLNYKATITFQSGTSIIGNIVSVKVPVSTGKILFPLNIITTQGGEIGTVKTYDNGEFNDVRVRLGEVFGEYVEIVSCAKNCTDLNVITNDVSNYDANKFMIVEK